MDLGESAYAKRSKMKHPWRNYPVKKKNNNVLILKLENHENARIFVSSFQNYDVKTYPIEDGMMVRIVKKK